MSLLSKNPRTIFLGQSVTYPGNLIYKSLEMVKKEKKIELPVFEENQMGISIGLALEGFLPITTYPRFDFLLLAFNQLINHLDKFPIITNKQYIPKIIIRTLVGSKKPLDAGEQHTQNYVKELRSMCKTIKIFNLLKKEKIFLSYKDALKSNSPCLMVEYSDKYNY